MRDQPTFLHSTGFPARPRPTGAPWRAAVLPLLLLATLPGCAKRTTPVYATRLSEGTPAVAVHPSKNFWGTRAYVSKVDGVRVAYQESFFDDGRAAPVKVAAGFHDVQVTVDAGQVLHFWKFGFDFKAGHAYRVSPTTSYQVRLEDLTAGASTVIQGPTKL